MYQKINKIGVLYASDFRARFYLREIAKKAFLPLRTTQRILEELEKEKIIKASRGGKNKYYALNLENIKTKFFLLEAEIYKTSKFLDRYPIFLTFLKEHIHPTLVVFGSFAKLTAEKDDDLDLLVIENKKNKKESLPQHLIPYSIHAITMNNETFHKALNQAEPLIKEILKNHTILRNHSYFIDILWEHYGRH